MCRHTGTFVDEKTSDSGKRSKHHQAPFITSLLFVPVFCNGSKTIYPVAMADIKEDQLEQGMEEPDEIDPLSDPEERRVLYAALDSFR